jgi:hypothetical protein
LTRVKTKFVVGYVGSVKNTYFVRNCAGARSTTYSSSPRQPPPRLPPATLQPGMICPR